MIVPVAKLGDDGVAGVVQHCVFDARPHDACGSGSDG